MAENPGVNIFRNIFFKPQVNLGCSTLTRMWLVNICAFLAVIQSGLTDSFRSLILAVVSIAAALLTEFLFLYNKNKTALLKDGSAVASALVFTLLLPDNISPLYALLGIVFAIAVIKHCFGGLGSNWLNPAVGGWLFIRMAWPGAFDRALEGSLLFPAGYIEFFAGQSNTENSLYWFLNNSVFSLFKTELPSAYMDLFVCSRPGIIADRGILFLLLGTVLITAFRAGRSWLPALWIAVFLIFVRFAGSPEAAGWNGDVLYALFSGGTLAAAFILSADPATSAKPNWLIVTTAMCGGFLAWFFRFPGAEPYGAVISVAVLNALLPVIRNIENYLKYEKGSIS